MIHKPLNYTILSAIPDRVYVLSNHPYNCSYFGFYIQFIKTNRHNQLAFVCLWLAANDLLYNTPRGHPDFQVVIIDHCRDLYAPISRLRESLFVVPVHQPKPPPYNPSRWVKPRAHRLRLYPWAQGYQNPPKHWLPPAADSH